MPQTRALNLAVMSDRLIANTLCENKSDSHPFRETDGTAYRVWDFSEVTRPPWIEENVVGAVAEWIGEESKGAPDSFHVYYSKEKFLSYFAGIANVAVPTVR